MKPLPVAHNIVKWLADPADILGVYYTKAQQLKQLNDLWQQHMDAALTRYTHVANVTDTQLIIEVNNSAWATRMHYVAPDLLQQVRQWPTLAAIQAVTWYIKPQSDPALSTQPPIRTPHLSQQNKQLLDSMAQTIESPELKQALFNLSKVCTDDEHN